ncbi:preprotein translocase subunit SecG [Deferrisoma camini]|uniref:preprotein translocase subunit SecG n=1 Tax=Deferrisoma camini TaxID=1035120 RepID=UPI00046CB2BA|nr:preprotein translocase subunit SecG [Deferrisoma camini]
MYTLLIVVHVIVSFILVGIVLLQQGKGADMGAVFGGSSQTLFGSSGGTTFLGKLTAVAAGVFMLTSLGLTYMASHRYKVSVVPDQPAATAPAPQQAPAQQPPADQPAGEQK